MDKPYHTVSFGGEGPAWKIIYLPKGYGPNLKARVVWERELRQSDHNLPEGVKYPPDVQEELERLNRKLRTATGVNPRARWLESVFPRLRMR
jgi:hypothetical protein